MKYIRTKDDKIYEIIDETENGFELCSPFEKKMGCSCIMIKRLLGSNEKPTYRLANTVEELCDEFVEYGNRPIVITQANVKRGRMSGKTRIILGAIWTEKGLIYVAKMNDKGELELL